MVWWVAYSTVSSLTMPGSFEIFGCSKSNYGGAPI